MTDEPRRLKVFRAGLALCLLAAVIAVFVRNGGAPPPWFADTLHEDGNEGLFHALPCSPLGDRMPLFYFLPLSLLHALGDPGLRLLTWIEAGLFAALGLLIEPAGPLVSLIGLGLHGGRLDWGSSERFFVLFVLLSCGFLVWRAQKPSPWRSLLLAAALGASALYQSTLAFFAPVLALFEWAFDHRFSARAYWRHALILAAIPVLFLLPWVRANWAATRRLVPFEATGADDIVIAGALGYVYGVEGTSRGRGLLDAPLDESGPAPVLRRAALEIARRPGRYSLGVAKRLWFVLSEHPFLWAAALLAVAANRKRRDVLQLALFAAYYVGIYCLLAVQTKYFLPLWPVVAILGGSVALRLPAPDAARLPGLRVASLAFFHACLAAVVGLCVFSWFLLGRAAPLGSPLVERRKALDAQVQSHPTEAFLLEARGATRLRLGDVRGAAEDFTRAYRLSPDDEVYRLRLAIARMLQGDLRPLSALDGREMLKRHWTVARAFGHFRLGHAAEARRLLAELPAVGESNAPSGSDEHARARAAASKPLGGDLAFHRIRSPFLDQLPLAVQPPFLRALERWYPGSKELHDYRASLEAALRSEPPCGRLP